MASQSMPHLYQYQRLSRKTKAIRVIRLFPAKTLESELFCNIVEVELDSDDIPAYEAISYAWEGQSPNGDQYITCDGSEKTPQRVYITKNSATALSYLRKTDSDRMLWMDSICIDQSSTEDRNHQVRLMCDIYTRAKRVLIWLGEDKNFRIGPVFGLLRHLSRIKFHEGPEMVDALHDDSSDEEEETDEDEDMEDDDEDGNEDDEDMEDDYQDDSEDEDDENEDDDDDDEEEEEEEEEEDKHDSSDRSTNSAKPMANKHHQRIKNQIMLKMQDIFTVSPDDPHDEIYSWHLHTEIFGRPWFNRMWTLQEIALADPKTALVTCGHHQIKWGYLQKASLRLHTLGLDSRDLVNATMNLCFKLHLYLRCIRHARYDLLSEIVHPSVKNLPVPQASGVFADCRTRECTDQKDMAFALYGVCSELKIKLPQPDYKKSATQVFTEVARAIITHDKSLAILFHVNSPRRNADLPSWVPDWSDYTKVEGLTIRYRLSTFYKASSSSKSICSFGQDSKSLVLLAKVVGKVSSAGILLPVVEEDPKPRLRSVLDTETQDYFPRNYDVWKALQSWARMVSGLDNSACRYAVHEAAWQMAMMSTLTADSNGGMTNEELMESSPEKFIQQAEGFASWYRSLNGQDDFEKDLIEKGLIKTPGELPEEKLAQLHMGCSLFLDEDQQRRKFHDNVWAFNRGKSFFITDGGWMGTVEGAVQNGYIVAIIAGLSMPIVLERVDGNYFRLVGHAYVHGLMKGEEWPECLEGLEMITIV